MAPGIESDHPGVFDTLNNADTLTQQLQTVIFSQVNLNMQLTDAFHHPGFNEVRYDTPLGKFNINFKVVDDGVILLVFIILVAIRKWKPNSLIAICFFD